MDFLDMELMGRGGRGIVKVFEAAENGEPLAYGAAAVLLIYIAVAFGFLVYSWATGRFIERKRGWIRSLLGFGVSVCFSGYLLYGIVSRLLSQ